jgi:two-component system, NtrC family, response regulator
MSGFIRVSSNSRFHGYPEDAPSMSGINIQTAMLLGVDPEACEVGTELLGRCGLATMRLSTVADLRRGISEQEACLVLCEDVLPDGDFRDVLKVVHDSKASVPVILFSRLADWDEYLAAVKLGAHDLLRFPFRTGELQWVIDRALAGHPLSTS